MCSVEGFVGIIFHAFVTGSLFAKLARPIARIKFADNCLLQTANGQTVLVFRLVNERRTPVINVTIRAAALMKNVQSDDAGAIQITEDFVQARVPPPMRPEDIPPPRKSGRPRAVQFM